MIALILAAGDQTRWGDNENPKQLLDVGGETVLERIVRQVNEFDCATPVIVTHDGRLTNGSKAQRFTPVDRSSTLSSWLSTRSLWEDRTIVLLGDTYFTCAAMHTIMGCRDPLRVFGRTELKYRLVGRYYEIFAVSYSIDLAEPIAGMLTNLIESTPLRRRKIRQFYDVWCGLPPWEFKHEGRIMCPINDLTEDFDAPEDYEQFRALIINQGRLDDVSH